MHKKARLGLNEDKRKSSLIIDNRLKTLKDLATIELMPVQRLMDFQHQLADLKSCFTVTQQELEKSAVCPHCNFRPSTEDVKHTASIMLDQLNNELDNLVSEWTKTILTNLKDPSSQNSLGLLGDDSKQQINEFFASQCLPENITSVFIQALKEVLAGLLKVTITTEGLREALLSGGSPTTSDVLKNRFKDYIDEIVKGKEQNKVRIVLE